MISETACTAMGIASVSEVTYALTSVFILMTIIN